MRLRLAQELWIEAAGISKPSHAPAGHAGNTPLNFVSLAEFLLLLLEQAQQRSIDVAEAEQAKIVDRY